jgi:type II secretory pathway component PulF
VASEYSGTLSGTMLKIGEMYEAKTDITTKNLSTVLEPILLVIVWLGVVGVAFAVVLPIYSLIGGFNPE